MKSNRLLLALTAVSLLATALIWPRSPVRSQTAAVGSEYLTLRWGGRDNTHIIRPGGQVEFIGPELRKLTRPDRCDERSFYLNSALNGLVKEGWEFAGMTDDTIILRRPLAP